MRSFALKLAIAGVAVSAFAAGPAPSDHPASEAAQVQRIPVEELEHMVARGHGKLDAEVARELAGIELTERLSTARLAQLRADLPGDKSRQALLVLADTSAFLEPPASEIPATATPTLAAQQRMMTLTVSYLGKSLPLLPNLFATRDTVRFESKPIPAGSADFTDNPLHEVGRSAVTVLYRDNQEFVDAGSKKTGTPGPPDRGLATWGEFGPILGIVMIDAARSRLTWSHWELSPTGPQAVFHYSVPREKSHYDVRFCCVSDSYGMPTNILRQRAGYHGEITVDPSNGAILRLTAEADVDKDNPISRASIVVEYGPVDIGGKAYICPVRGIALATAPDLKALRNIVAPAGRQPALPPLEKTSLSTSEPEIPRSPQQMLLNDVAFRHYHLFRVDARVVSAKDTEEASSQPAPSLSGAAPASEIPSSENARPAADVAMPTPAPAAAPSPAAQPAAEVAAAPAPAAAAAPVPEPVVPEISVFDATGLPKEPALAKQSSPDGGFTLHVTSRLVDMNVVAVDKKGRPMTNLKPEDFEIYDNGVKQQVRSFGQASAAKPAETATAAPAQDQPAFSNHGANAAKSDASNENTIVILIDGSNLAYSDFVDVREQVIKFLQNVPGEQRVALYAMKGHGYEVLEEATLNYEHLKQRLSRWTPTAQDVANANDEEDRNRQTMDTVHNPEDLLSVNGNYTLDTTSQQQSLDAKLRELGSRPGPNALSLLVDVAGHLAPMPGHKSLVWITSDNVLADWNRMSDTVETKDKHIEPVALRAQEAMNNAHVSVYPLDASRLEGNAVDASHYGRNVELTPTFIPLPNGTVPGGLGPEATSGASPINLQQATDMGRDITTNRLYAQMQQDMHPIQGVFRELADATGGRAFRRSNNMIGELGGVVNDGRATYLLGFSPSQPADGQYHLLTVKVVGHKDVTVRYRAGYKYEKDPSTLKDRFVKAVWQATDASDIGVSASPEADGSTLKLKIAANDLAVAQDGESWTDKVDIFLVRRDDEGHHAQVTGQTMALKLTSGTYQKLLREGIPFDQIVEKNKDTGSVRIVVVDENSGRMGTITVPLAPAASRPKV
jgi:VWFA-related protein